jgi:hypothetical protein
MSLVFGGKLLAPKQTRTMCPEQANLTNTKEIQSLSRREQELLQELQKTRTNIVKELVRISPEVQIEEVDSWKNTLKKYKSNLNRSMRRPLSTSSGTRRSQGPQRSETPSSHSFQSIPIMSSTGEFAFSLKSRREEPIVLPVLSLPAVRPPLKAKSLRTESMPCNSFPPPRIGDTSILLLDVDQSDVEFMLDYFSITLSTWREVSENFETLCKYVEPSSNDQSDNLMPTVFASTNTRTRDLSPIDDSKSLSSSTFGNSQSRSFGNSLPPLRPNTRQPTPQSLFRGSDLHQFNSSEFDPPKSVMLTRSMSTKRAEAGPSKTRKRFQSIQYLRPELSSSDSLRQELIKSLGSMQQHTAEVCHRFTFYPHSTLRSSKVC